MSAAGMNETFESLSFEAEGDPAKLKLLFNLLLLFLVVNG